MSFIDETSACDSPLQDPTSSAGCLIMAKQRWRAANGHKVQGGRPIMATLGVRLHFYINDLMAGGAGSPLRTCLWSAFPVEQGRYKEVSQDWTAGASCKSRNGLNYRDFFAQFPVQQNREIHPRKQRAQPIGYRSIQLDCALGGGASRGLAPSLRAWSRPMRASVCR